MLVTLTQADHNPKHNPPTPPTQGPQGEKGDMGEQGETGQEGDTGPMGDKGDPGIDGVEGADGEKGKAGKDADMMKVNTNARLSASNANRVEDVEGRVGELEEAKWLLDTEVRLADGKHVAVSLYNSYDWRHRRNFAFGMKFLFKLGKSYEERRIEKLEKLLYEIQKSHGLILEVVIPEENDGR